TTRIAGPPRQRGGAGARPEGGAARGRTGTPRWEEGSSSRPPRRGTPLPAARRQARRRIRENGETLSGIETIATGGLRRPFAALYGCIPFGDEPGGPAARDVVPRPLHQHQQAVLEADDVHQVDEQPCQPGEVTVEAHPAQVSDGTSTANGRHAALVLVD